jgi:hypothetical protein
MLNKKFFEELIAYFPPMRHWPLRKDTFEYTAVACMFEALVNIRPTVSRPVCLLVGRFFFCLTIAGFLMWRTLSRERMGLYFTRTIASGPYQSSHSRARVPQNSRLTICYDLIWDSPQLGGPGPSIYIPQEESGLLYSRALGSLFVASYDSQIIYRASHCAVYCQRLFQYARIPQP